MTTLQEIRKIARTHLKISNPKVRLLGSGQSNANFIVDEKYLVRVSGNPENKISNEYNCLKYLEKFGIAPKTFVKDTSNKIIKQDFLINEFIPGNTLNKKRITNRLIKDLANITAELHSKPIKKTIPKFRRKYSDVLVSCKKMINTLKKLGGKEEARFLKSCFDNLKLKGPLNKDALGHGDICDRNLIYDLSGKMRFIDFEGCGIYDPAYDVADIFTGFGKEISEKNQKLFFQEYEKYRKDNTLRERVKVFVPLKIFETFCWSVMHVYEVKKGVVSKEIIEKSSLQSHINYANKFLKKCEKEGIVREKINLFESL